MDMLDNYIIYLNFINSKLEKFFNQQKPFIFCKKGCAKCCKNAEFPYSLLEIKYLLTGLLMLSPEIQSKVEANLQALNQKKKNFNSDKKFLYDCPFLIDNVCCVYEYRGVICRAFGLMTQNHEDGKIKAPLCFDQGLNYSNVIDTKTGKISEEMYKKLNCEEEPIAYNVSYKFLTSEAFEKDFRIKFGDRKPLVDWFLENAEEFKNETDLPH